MYVCLSFPHRVPLGLLHPSPPCTLLPGSVNRSTSAPASPLGGGGYRSSISLFSLYLYGAVICHHRPASWAWGSAGLLVVIPSQLTDVRKVEDGAATASLPQASGDGGEGRKSIGVLGKATLRSLDVFG